MMRCFGRVHVLIGVILVVGVDCSRPVDIKNGTRERDGDPNDPEVVKAALRMAWSVNNDLGQVAKRDVALTKKCYVNPLSHINGGGRGKLGRVRQQWKEQFPGDFMDAASSAAGLVSKFSQLAEQKEGSKSGSKIYVSDGGQLFLKSEGMAELKVFLKRSQRKRGKPGPTFLQEYVKRVTGRDVNRADRECQRSSLMRFMLVFTVRCGSKKVVWMLLANVSPLPKVPRSINKFDLKASRDMDDCSAKGWGATNGKQGYLGDFLSLYKDPVTETECTSSQIAFRNTSRKICFMKALHLDLRLLGRYNLVDYSFFATVHEYDRSVDAKAMQKYNNLLPVVIRGQEKVMTIGTIDLLKDWDAETGIRIQNYLGLNKGLSFTKTLFGQRKFDSYPYYLFCLAVDLLDPPCENERSLQLLSGCKNGDDMSVYFPEAVQASENGERKMKRYMEELNYCDLVNSCNALVRVPDAGHNLNVCQTHACKILGFKRCPVDTEATANAGGIWSYLGRGRSRRKRA